MNVTTKPEQEGHEAAPRFLTLPVGSLRFRSEPRSLTLSPSDQGTAR
jgi:hypothetical protein